MFLKLSRALLTAILTASLLVACGSPQDAGVYEAAGDEWNPIGLKINSISGQRDGADIVVTYEYVGAEETTLDLELKIHVDPRPSLDTGRWVYQGPDGTSEGTVLPEKIHFNGGQGEAPSLGGRFVLNEAGQPRFKIVVPNSRVGRAFGV